MLMDMGLVVAGLILLVFAGDALVRGAVSLALKLGIPALIVSLTVVAFGTSAPELLVAVQSALEGAPGIAFGNVVGSNIANVLLVLGIPAMISGLQPLDDGTRRSQIIMICTTLLFIAMCFGGSFGPMQGALLLGLLAAMIFDQIRVAKKKKALNGDVLDPEVEEGDPQMPGPKVAMWLLAGMVGLPLGAHLLIEGSVGLAKLWGMSEAVIGLTIVAIGTSLPELATAIVAAMKRQADVALGNVIGSNIFNILAIMGVASFFGPLAVPPELLRLDLWVMLGSALLLVPFAIGGYRLSFKIGLVFTLLYSGYVLLLIT